MDRLIGGIYNIIVLNDEKFVSVFLKNGYKKVFLLKFY